MKVLTLQETECVAGGFKLKLHFNVIQAVFTVIGAGLLGGPVGAGMAVAAAIGTQGAGNLIDLYNQENGNQQ
ncbi:MAG: hypothetical protein JSR17_01675 [Proteobacteria bacterium]|nr:hypothetical protein [Pseudomonadota bacterium]